MADALDCDIEVYEFEFQSRYNVHFRTNSKPWTPLSPEQWV